MLKVFKKKVFCGCGEKADSIILHCPCCKKCREIERKVYRDRVERNRKISIQQKYLIWWGKHIEGVLLHDEATYKVKLTKGGK